MSSLTRFAVLALAACALAVPSFARQQHDADKSREHWQSMTPEERSRLQERFERFKKLSPDERKALELRAARLEALRSELLATMTPEQRAKLAGLTPRQRLEVLHDMLEERMHERGRRMGEMLPQSLRDQLAKATPEERPHLMREFFEREHRERADRMLEHVARELSLAPAEVERIKSLPDDQRFEALLDLHRRMLVKWFDTHGLPSWLHADEWKALAALSTHDFFDRLHSLRRERAPEDGPFFGPGEHGGAHTPFGARHGFDAPQEWRDLLRPDPQWWFELSKLPREKRREAIDERIRARVLEKLEQSPELATRAQVEALRAKRGREFVEGVRELMHEKYGERPQTHGDGR